MLEPTDSVGRTMSGKMQTVMTVDHELIKLKEPHTYSVRQMKNGKVVNCLVTDDLDIAREEYGKYYPPRRFDSAPSLRVDGQALIWDSELYLMLGIPGRKPKKPKDPKQAKQRPENPPFARVKKQGHKKAIFLNKTASYMLLGIGRVHVDVDAQLGEIVILKDPDGLKLSNVASGREVCACNALRGVDIEIGKRFPVEPCEGGLKIFYGDEKTP